MTSFKPEIDYWFKSLTSNDKTTENSDLFKSQGLITFTTHFQITKIL